jgi:hypothetical protein
MDQGEAIVEAAKIAADSARINAYIGAVGTVGAVIGAAIAGAVAYINTRNQMKITVTGIAESQAAVKTALKVTLKSTITIVEGVLSTYQAFRTPVELSVLPLPAALNQHDRKEFYFLGSEVIESIGIVEMALDDYRRAKHPIQQSFRSGSDKVKLPVVLNGRPDGFDAVIKAVVDYRAGLIALGDRLL